MACSNPCENESSSPEIWAILVSIIILMVAFGYISSKISSWRRKKHRAETIPGVKDPLRAGVPYNVVLSDGRRFENVEIVGTVEEEDDQFSFAQWEGMLVLRNSSSRRIFVKKPSVRIIEEI